MTVSFHQHSPVNDANERRALCRVARSLNRHYGRSPQHFSLIANIIPRADQSMQNKAQEYLETGRELSQLDALLFGPNFVAILEFKRCLGKIDIPSPTKKWQCGDTPMLGGANINPYQQAQYAHWVWSIFLEKESLRLFADSRSKTFLDKLARHWHKLHTFVLVHPFLQLTKSSSVSVREMEQAKSSYWFRLRSINDILELTYSAYTNFPALTASEIDLLVTNSLHAKHMSQLVDLIDDEIGFLVIYEPNKPLIQRPLHSIDEVTIGRSSTQDQQISRDVNWVSGAHALIIVNEGQIRLFDNNSKNGIFVQGQRIGKEGIAMEPGVKAFLGADDVNTCQIWFKPRDLQTLDPTKNYTRLTK